ESPIMSTYLVAVVVGLFDYVENHTSDGIIVRVYCQVGKRNQRKFALDVAVKSLELYKEYFATPYSLPKLDMVAILDFAARAMENYGLVTYRETALLYNDQRSAAANKQRVEIYVEIVVAHELAHQWFRNLITMEWWTQLWLNEGFTTWVSYLAADSIFPDSKIWTQFLDQSTDGHRMDGLAESHPIEVDVNHAREIDEIFDAISYRKGASLIRMLQSYLGPDCFQRSLASYQKGYPVVSVKFKDQKLEFEQTVLVSGATGEGKWIVPITLGCGSYNARKNFLLRSESESLDVSDLLGSSTKEDHREWIKINVDQTGFYRVKYDDNLAARLRYAIQANSLSATDRFGVLDDSFALSMACKQLLSSLLSLMSAYREELEYTVLSHLISVSTNVAKIAADATPELLDEIKMFFINLFQYSAEKLGWEPKAGESHLDAMLRREILTALAVLGHDLTKSETTRRFHAFVDNKNTPLLPPNTRKAAYVAVMQTVSSSDRSDPDIVLETLNFMISSEVRSQDAVFGLAVSSEGRETTWRWLKDNWDHLMKTYGSGFLITRFISAVVSPFSSYEKAVEVEEFFVNRSNPSIMRTLKQSLERVHINVNWVRNVQEEKTLAEVDKELAYRNC
ncbi:hypothetical protein GIB67_023830, partial [Kingdonia uniflora]